MVEKDFRLAYISGNECVYPKRERRGPFRLNWVSAHGSSFYDF
jgi:hypothetical protein